jgi:hypothetical protein
VSAGGVSVPASRRATEDVPFAKNKHTPPSASLSVSVSLVRALTHTSLCVARQRHKT